MLAGLLIILRMVDNLNPWKSRPLLHIFPLNVYILKLIPWFLFTME